MKKILLLATLALGLAACSGDKETPIYDLLLDGDLYKYAREFSVNLPGLELESYTIGLDTTQLFFSGRIDKRLWVAGYDIKSKKQLYEWHGNTVLESVIKEDLGYGESKEYEINKYVISTPYIYKNNGAFILSAILDMSARHQIVWVENNQMKTPETISFYFGTGRKWYEDSFIYYYGGCMQCYKVTGELLFEHEYKNMTVSYDHLFPIGYENGIYFSFNLTTPGFTFYNKNINPDSEVWKAFISTPEITEKIRVDNYEVNQISSLLYYTINCTLYSGKKCTFKFKVDLENKEVELWE